MKTSFESVLKDKNRMHLEPKPGDTRPAAVFPVAFVLLENFSMMAFTGAVDALVTTNLMNGTPLYQVLVVGEQDVVVSDLGISIAVDCRLADLNGRGMYMVVVCGGFRTHLHAIPLLRSKLRQADAGGALLGGLWNGAYFLAEAGLMDGHECAFHPEGRVMMAELFPRVKVTTHSYVVDRKRISCAGANSSLNMMLEVVRKTADAGLIGSVEEVLSCDRMGQTYDVSVASIDLDTTLPNPLRTALELMHSNIEDPIEIDEIARYSGISRRHLERLFCRHMKATPPRYYLELRLSRARQLLQYTNKSLLEVAVACGFVTLSHFQRRFREMFGVAPGRFRKRRNAQ
ncbi:GlxA family transcriptional regulator [Pseudomonas sp. GOM7]|uniref:GlxA family transcriptional regulator n=1 Tax=unclassified Pseudomonas TaxID=196821 RepID=UPI00227B5382|nr:MULTISPECIES: GlxA family transcriptional regulator [unclassified Pseudomonas]WAJ39871.1 GlxA family transcriptional regulator [Pseudomonas sp. GOM7]